MSQHAATDRLIDIAIHHTADAPASEQRATIEACIANTECPHVRRDLEALNHKINQLEGLFKSFCSEDCRLSV